MIPEQQQTFSDLINAILVPPMSRAVSGLEIVDVRCAVIPYSETQDVFCWLRCVFYVRYQKASPVFGIAYNMPVSHFGWGLGKATLLLRGTEVLESGLSEAQAWPPSIYGWVERARHQLEGNVKRAESETRRLVENTKWMDWLRKEAT